MKRRAILGLALVAAAASAAERPNVLVVMADDCTFRDLPLYGGQNARTPHIDRLAAEGLTFDHAYLASAMCQPCRAELYTGQFPLRNGCAWNHSASHPETRSLPHYLEPLGYRVGLAGKVHVEPDMAFPFENVGGFDPNCVRAPTHAHNVEAARAFMAADDPFCLVVALVEPHVPWVMGDASQYPANDLKLPPNLADTPETRRDFSRYLAEIAYMDGQLGEILQALEGTGKSDATLVLFTSEQGSQFPGNKWTNWDTGLHTALVARWPGNVPAGKRTAAMVHYADVLPTLIALAGGDAPDAGSIDGISFERALLGESDAHREFAFGIHNNVPEGPPYPVRSVTDGTFRYIRNLAPRELYIEKHLMGVIGGSAAHNPYWTSWPRESESSPRIYQLVKRYMLRPAEELYRTTEDPYELRNLADDSEFAESKARLSAELDRWMTAQGDPGVPQDTRDALEAARRGEHLFGPES